MSRKTIQRQIPITNEESEAEQLTEEDILMVKKKLLHWYDKNQRFLPWRIPTKNFRDNHGTLDPTLCYIPGSSTPFDHSYGVLVGELMSQQTQIGTLIPYYNRWMTRFPDILSVANATLDEVNEVWAGLGYYRRAKLLHECAKTIINHHNGQIPGFFDQLISLPGIGPYTAGAIASTTSGEVVPAVDGNVARVLTRLRAFSLSTQTAKGRKWLWNEAEKLVCKDRPGDMNQALMELGAIICAPKNPSCIECCLKSMCKAYQGSKTNSSIDMARWGALHLAPSKDMVTQFPVASPKTRRVEMPTIICIVMCTPEHTSQPEFLILQRGKTGLLAGMWEFPSMEVLSDDFPASSKYLKVTKRKSAGPQKIQAMLDPAEAVMDDTQRVIAPKSGNLAQSSLSPSIADGKSSLLRIQSLGVNLGVIKKLWENVLITPLDSGLILKHSHLGFLTHNFTHIHQRLCVEFLACDERVKSRLKIARPSRWVCADQIEKLATSTGTRKCLGLLLQVEKI